MLLTPDLLLHAYASGIFPMAESAFAQELHWYDPPMRALIPLSLSGTERFHIPRRLRRTVRQRPYGISLNTAFTEVMRACAAPRLGHPETWINAEIISLYTTLHHRGHAHSVEIWQGEDLVGGLYGVSLGTAFFGESMFSTAANASKIALIYLVALMKQCGFTLLDTQFQTEHLQQFGTYEVPRITYLQLLDEALQSEAGFGLPASGWDYLVDTLLLQPMSQMS